MQIYHFFWERLVILDKFFEDDSTKMTILRDIFFLRT